MTGSNAFPVWPGWQTVGVIGRGSFGAVYEIERDHYGHKEKAALKVVSIPHDDSEIYNLITDGYDEKSITERFSGYLKDCMREYSIMADMRGCANIVYCDDVREIQHSDGIGWDIFIRMELLKRLSDVVGIIPSDEQVIRIGSDICSALIFCEKRNLLHRDIKPQNIFMSSDGTYKLGDFGIAKVVDSTARGTATGTFNYMAPEIRNRQPYGTKADMYSLGLVLYWLLNERRLPFLPLPPAVPAGQDEVQARDRRFRGDALPPPAHGSEALKQAVLKACAFNSEDRFRTAAEMRDALAAAGSPSSGTVDDTTVIDPPPPPKRFPIKYAVLAAVILPAVIGGIMLYSGGDEQLPLRSDAPVVTAPPADTPEPVSEPTLTAVPSPTPEPTAAPGITTPKPGTYRSSSSTGTRLQFPLAGRTYDTPFIAIVRAKQGVSIYLMPMPESGHGNMGTVGDGEEVAILGYHDDYYFFLTADGRYGWNGKKYFEVTDRLSFSGS